MPSCTVELPERVADLLSTTVAAVQSRWDVGFDTHEAVIEAVIHWCDGVNVDLGTATANTDPVDPVDAVDPGSGLVSCSRSIPVRLRRQRTLGKRAPK